MLNKIILMGRLTRDPELRSTAGGLPVLGFGVAVNDRRKNQQTGEWEDYPNFIDCTMFGARAESLSRYLSKIFISGRTPRKRSRSITHKFRSKFTAHIYIRKNTKETKQVDYTQTSVKIYSTYLYQEEHQGNKTGRLHTNFGQNLQHIFISGRTPRKRNRSITHKFRSKFTAHIYSTYLYQEEHQGD